MLIAKTISHLTLADTLSAQIQKLDSGLDLFAFATRDTCELRLSRQDRLRQWVISITPRGNGTATHPHYGKHEFGTLLVLRRFLLDTVRNGHD